MSMYYRIGPCNILEAGKNVPDKLADKTISSKYGSGFSYVSEAPLKEIKSPLIEIVKDTIVGDDRQFEICITPQREVNRLEVFTNDIQLT